MNRHRPIWIVAFSVLQIFASNVFAADVILRLDEPSSDLDRSIGSHLRLEIIVKPDSNEDSAIPWTIEFSSPRRWLTHGPLLIDAYSIGTREERLKRIHIDGIIIADGQAEIPPFKVRQEGETTTFETNTIQLNAKSNFKTPEEKKKFKPSLVSPFEHGGFNQGILGFVAALLLALLLWFCFFMYKFIKRKFRLKEPTPKQIADTEILKLRALSRDTSETSEFSKKFSYEVSTILRAYLAKRLELPLLESTDSELIKALSDRAFQPDQLNKCQSILDSTFMERYYHGAAIDREGARKILNTLSEIIVEVEEDFDSPTKKISSGGIR